MKREQSFETCTVFSTYEVTKHWSIRGITLSDMKLLLERWPSGEWLVSLAVMKFLHSWKPPNMKNPVTAEAFRSLFPSAGFYTKHPSLKLCLGHICQYLESSVWPFTPALTNVHSVGYNGKFYYISLWEPSQEKSRAINVLQVASTSSQDWELLGAFTSHTVTVVTLPFKYSTDTDLATLLCDCSINNRKIIEGTDWGGSQNTMFSLVCISRSEFRHTRVYMWHRSRGELLGSRRLAGGDRWGG